MTDLSTRAGGTASDSPEDLRASAAAALLASNRRRRRIRRWIAIGTLPLTLAALLFVGKILSMYAFAHQSITAYVADDYAGSEASARGQEFVNWFEPFKAPFNVGTALAGAEKLPEARAKLEESLDLATGLEVCTVRINLALVLERMGDAARAEGDGAGAAEFYGEALTVTTEMPEECNSDEAQEQSSDPDRDMQQSREDLEDRLKQKQQNEQPPPEEEQEQEPQPSEEKLEELEDKLEQGTQERDQQQGDDGGGSGTDKPW
ncbi:tetratricopeptide repeat protein [uncultured Microbacterium sp.]|uniref:tetratricopeptide repeat protein n=1 Tax=uncultured Microbacterium sp. TaxID=191216 RepID=UPI0025EC1F49|nr:tetratricopeptide repeat protein [uncultured Microbacterium sp.]